MVQGKGKRRERFAAAGRYGERKETGRHFRSLFAILSNLTTQFSQWGGLGARLNFQQLAVKRVNQISYCGAMLALCGRMGIKMLLRIKKVCVH